MSTDHPVLQECKNTELLSLNESSCQFNLYHAPTADSDIHCIKRDMSVEDLKVMNQRISEIISYYDPDYTGTKV